MKDSFDEDPFAEYDKYWDELDRLEEKAKKKEEQRFHPKEQRDDKPNDINRKKFTSVIFVIGVFIAFYYIFVGTFDKSVLKVISQPFILFIIIGIIISSVNKKNKH